MVFPNKAGQKNAGQKLTEHYLLNELWSELDETSQAAMSGGVTGAGIFLFEVSKGGRSTSNITNSTFANNSAGSGYTMLQAICSSFGRESEYKSILTQGVARACCTIGWCLG